MSRKEEHRSSLDLLKHKLMLLGLQKDTAAKNLLASLGRTKASEEVIEDVNSMISIAVSETKTSLKKSLKELADSL